MAAATETLDVAVPPAPGTLMETQPSAQKLAQRRAETDGEDTAEPGGAGFWLIDRLGDLGRPGEKSLGNCTGACTFSPDQAGHRVREANAPVRHSDGLLGFTLFLGNPFPWERDCPRPG